MNKDVRVLFLGNHTVGVRTINVLRQHANLIGIVAHPDDPEDGISYESVYASALKYNIPVLRSTGKDQALEEFINRLQPALMWIADYRYLLPRKLIDLPSLGVVNLHPSLLPKYRGRAPVNWAILNGESLLGLTAHWVEEAMDSGNILAQETYHLSQSEDVSHALQKLYPLYESITIKVLNDIKFNTISSTRQDESYSSSFPRRTPKDGFINWNQPACKVWNLVRAVAPPYPGAYCNWNGGILKILKISRLVEFPNHITPVPGNIICGRLTDKELVICCQDKAIHVSKFFYEPL